MTIYMITLKQRWLLQEVRNVFYTETQVGNPSPSEWVDMADEVREDYDAYLDLYLSPQWAFYAIDYRIVDTPGLPTFSAVPTAGEIVGAGVGDDTPTQIAMLVSVKAPTTRPNRARSYLGGFTVGNLDESQWEALARDQAETFILNQSAWNSLGTNPLHRVAAQWNEGHTQVIDTNTLYLEPPVASIVPATQRRRRLGIGI
jgi:hypothetical protein